METTIQANPDGSIVTTTTISDLNSVSVEIGAKGEIKPSIKLYFADPATAKHIADQAVALCREILVNWKPVTTFHVLPPVTPA